MFTAQAEGAGQPALRGWDTVTLWGELSATRGRVSDASASGVSLGATKRGRARRLQEALGGAPHTFPFSSHAPRSLPSELPLPGLKARMSVLTVCMFLLRVQGRQGACERVVAGFTPLQVPPLAGLTWSSRALRGVCRLEAGGEAFLFGGGGGSRGG